MFSMIFYIPLYFQVVQGRSATDASLWLVIPVFGGMSGSIGGGLIIQATGKFYTLTVLGYLALFAGTMLVTLTSGIVVVSSIGIAMGKSVEL
jgi:hypothetical protein